MASQSNTDTLEGSRKENAATPPNPAVSPEEIQTLPGAEGTSLALIVEESKAKLHEEAQKELPKKRGRPPGSKTRPKDETPPQASAIPAPGPTQGASFAPILQPIVAFPFTLAADRTGCSAIRLDRFETETLAQAADAVAQKYFPQLSEKTSVLVTFGITLGMISLQKFMAYQEWLEEKRRSAEKARDPEPAAVQAPQPTGEIRAEHHFPGAL